MVRSFFYMWRPCRADDGPGGSPHCEAMARGRITARKSGAAHSPEVFPARASNPAVRPIAEQWHEGGQRPQKRYHTFARSIPVRVTKQVKGEPVSIRRRIRLYRMVLNFE